MAGRSLLLLAEQGLGDTLHFVRYARMLKERGARVVLACQAALGRLLASHPDVDELFILGSAEELPRLDFYLPLLSAPAHLARRRRRFPAKFPTSAADPELTDHWRQELAGIEGFKIGIAWQGSRDFPLDRWRSIPLAQFAPLASLPGVRLVSLQKGFGSEQVAAVDFPVLDLSDRLDEMAGPFMDTAAVIRIVDLVVTSDTAIAHLAGALGVAVWVALPFSPDWRWLLERDDSPWYPTMRLFRQTTIGEWPDVFARIASAFSGPRGNGVVEVLRAGVFRGSPKSRRHMRRSGRHRHGGGRRPSRRIAGWKRFERRLANHVLNARPEALRIGGPSLHLAFYIRQLAAGLRPHQMVEAAMAGGTAEDEPRAEGS